MEIKRVASNEEFIRKIILSIDNDYSNLATNRSSFYRFFREKLSDTGSATEAIEYAKEKLQRVVEKRNSRLTQKDNKTKFPESVEIVKKPTSYELQKEQSAFSNEVIEKRRQEILHLLKTKSGVEDEEALKYLLKRFRLTKDHFNLPDDAAADKVVYQYKEKLAKEALPESPPKPPSEEDLRKAARIIEYLDPKNVSNNLQRFQTYLSKHNIEKSFQFTQDYIKYRQILKTYGLKLDQSTIKIFDQYGQDYDKAIEVIKQRQEQGAMPIESRVLSRTKGIPSESNNALVDFQGLQVPLYRVLQKIYPNMHHSSFKKSYSTILNLIFLKGYTLDEAIAQNNKEELINRNKSMFQREFPEDPDQAEMIFESYYIDDGYSFEEALVKTKQDIYGNRSTTAQKAKYKIRIK